MGNDLSAQLPDGIALATNHKPLDISPAAFGELRRSNDIAGDGEALRERLAEEGYLYLPGVLNRDEVLSARRECMERLMQHGALQAGTDPMEGIAALEGSRYYFMESLAENNEPLLRVLYDGAMMALTERLFGGAVRHYDFTWMRAVGPGNGTQPHCDLVYMGRGTDQLVTAWTPLGDIPLHLGGLIILEGSHREKAGRLSEYLRQDVDTYCENGPNVEAIKTGKMHWEHYDGSYREWSGAFTDNAPELRQNFGGRWLTSPEYRMGDVLLFTMATMHASLDNQSDRIRLSSDTRYQPAHLPADPRWILGEHGEKPFAHGQKAKQGKIC